MATRATVRIHHGTYAREGREVEAFVTSPDSRWAVVKPHPKGGYYISHRASGKGVWSLYPLAVITKAACLRVVKAWEAHSELDWAALDSIPFGENAVQTPALTALVIAAREISRLAA